MIFLRLGQQPVPGVVRVGVPPPYALVPAIHAARQVAEKGSHLGVHAVAGHEVLDVPAIPGGVGATDQLNVLAGQVRIMASLSAWERSGR
jgi:hypothetical protein